MKSLFGIYPNTKHFFLFFVGDNFALSNTKFSTMAHQLLHTKSHYIWYWGKKNRKSKFSLNTDRIFARTLEPSTFVQDLVLRKNKYYNERVWTACLGSTQMFNILFGIFCWRWRWEILNGLLWLKRQLCSKRNTNRDVWRKCIIFWENFRLQLIGSG